MVIDPVSLTSELVRIRSVSGTSEEGHALELLAEMFEPRFELRSTSDERGLRSLAVVPKDSDGPLLVLSGHVDVVPVGDTAWERDPFGGDVEGERLFGRGSSDMKAGIASMTAGLLGAPTKAAVGALFTVEEEIGSKGAADAAGLLDDRVVDALLVAEPTNGRLIRGHKGVTWIRANTEGVAAHGSTPLLGSNAGTRLARALIAAEAADGPWDTVNIGVIKAGTAINIVPSHAWADVDMRSIGATGNLAGWWATRPEVDSVQTLLDLQPVLLDPADPLIQELGLEVDDLIAGYFTDAAVFIDVLHCSRLLLWGPGRMDQAHRLDEWVSVSSIVDAAAAYGDLIRRWSSR